MNPNHDHEPTGVDDLQDRLLARGLAEVVGGEAPPDLTERILACHSPAQPAGAAAPSWIGRRRWAAWAVAAGLLLAAVPLLLPAVQSARESARSEQRDDRASTLTAPAPAISQPGISTSQSFVESRGRPSPYYLSDDVLHSPPPGFALAPGAAVAEPKGESAARPGEPAASMPEGRSVANRLAPFPNFGTDLDIPFRQNSFDLTRLPQVTRNGRDFGNHPQMMVRPDILNREGRAWDVGVGDGLRPDKDTELGTGPGLSGDEYTRIIENRFIRAVDGEAVSTFSIDVDTASYANVRQFLSQLNQLPPPDAVRIEELVNYFRYDYAGPSEEATDAADDDATEEESPDDADAAVSGERAGTVGSDEIDSDEEIGASDESPAPFAAHVEVAGCPWAPEHRLVRIGIKGREMDAAKRPLSNLVFLVDVSGSMNEPSKLPLVIEGLRGLARELGENDRVAIVVYASSEGLVLPSTSGSDQATILGALERLSAGGSTAGGAGIQLAYQLAEDHFIAGGTNRVILCTDGDFNVGVTSTAELERMVEQKAKETGVCLSVLGFGRGNLNDAMMEAISNRGNGNYAYIDSSREARRVLVEQMTGTLVTIAKNVKIQVEFNPRQVAGYRLIGYENRLLRTEDFNDDTKDAGEIGAGHTVTALYEIVPAGVKLDLPEVDELKFQQPESTRVLPRVEAPSETPAASDSAASQPPQPLQGEPLAGSDEGDISGLLLMLKMRYKQPEGTKSRKLEWAVTDAGLTFGQASVDFQFAAAAAGFGMLLRDSAYKGNLTYDALLEIAAGGLGTEADEYRAEFLDLVRRAQELSGAAGRD